MITTTCDSCGRKINETNPAMDSIRALIVSLNGAGSNSLPFSFSVKIEIASWRFCSTNRHFCEWCFNDALRLAVIEHTKARSKDLDDLRNQKKEAKP